MMPAIDPLLIDFEPLVGARVLLRAPATAPRG